jgi:hypothetical protein
MKILDAQEELKPAAIPTIGGPEISVFLPVYNEEPNLMPLHAKFSRDRLRRRRLK